MKKRITIFSLLLLCGLTGFQCSKEEEEKDLMTCCGPSSCPEKATLNGTWRLTAFQNLTTGVLDTDPDPKGKGVVFTFTDDEKEGSIEGHTLVNTVFGAYTLKSGCSIDLKSFGGSKVGEPGWSRKAWLAAAEGSYVLQPDKLIITFKNAPERLIFTKLK